MERVIVIPESIRCLGNVISPKTVSDFMFSNSYIAEGTATIAGEPLPIFGTNQRNSEVISLSYNRFQEYTEELTSFPVIATLFRSNGNVYANQTLSCKVNDDSLNVLTGTTNSQGQVTFNIPVTNEGIYTFRVDYSTPAGQGVGGASKFGQTTIGTMNNLILQSETGILQKDDETFLMGALTGFMDEEPIGIPGQVINFYEEYTPTSLRITGSKNIFTSGEDVSIVSTLIDEDGSRINGEFLKVYQVSDNGLLVNDGNEYSKTYAANDNIYYIPNTELTDLPSKWELSFDFKTNGESRFFIGAKVDYTVPTNPDYSLFCGSTNGSNMCQGYRTTSTTATTSTASPTSYSSMKIVREGNTFKFTINGTEYTRDNITWFDDYDAYILGLVVWGSGKTVYVKNIKLRLIGDE